MHAVRFGEYGSADVLRYEEVPDPEPGPGEALVRVRACAVNHVDIDMRNGTSRLPITLPHILGFEIAGEVVAVGARVIAAAGADFKLERALEEGAEAVVNYSTEDLAARVRELTGGRGVDVVMESVGGDVLRASMEALAKDGKVVTVGGHAGEVVPVDVILLFRNQWSLIGLAASAGVSPLPRATVAEAGLSGERVALARAALAAYRRANSLNLLGMFALLEGCPGGGSAEAAPAPASKPILPMVSLESLA